MTEPLRAVAFDLKAFFTVTGKDPALVTAADVFDFLADQRGDRTVVPVGSRRPAEQDRPAAEPYEDEIKQAEGHG